MSITIAEFKSLISSKSSGYGIDRIPNFNSMLFESMIQVKSKLDLPSSIRKMPVLNPVYSGDFLNTLPSDISLNGIVDFIPSTLSNNSQSPLFFNMKDFLNQRQEDLISFPYMAIVNFDGVQQLLLNYKEQFPLKNNFFYDGKNTTGITTNNTTYNAYIDYQYGLTSQGALSLNLGVGANGFTYTLNNNSIFSIKNNQSITDILLYFNLPSLSNFQNNTFGSITMTINYNTNQTYSITQSKNTLGNNISVGNNVCAFNLQNKNFINISSITFTFNGILTNSQDIKIFSINASFGYLGDIIYYTENQFLGTDGTRKKIPTLDTDIILLSDEELNIFKNQFVLYFSTDLKQSGGFNADLITYASNNLENLYNNFQLRHPSQRKVLRETYYGGNIGNGYSTANSKL